MKRFRVLIAAIALTIAAPATIAPAAHAAPMTKVVVTHAPVTPTAVIGSGLGMVRVFSATTSATGPGPNAGYFTGTLTTMSSNTTTNEEVRASNLIFVFGDEPNQLVVGGISIYPADGSTLAAGTKTVRPIIGGSGEFAGAKGQVVSKNRGDKGWKHVFRFRM